jgi:hypothetical protein
MDVSASGGGRRKGILPVAFSNTTASGGSSVMSSGTWCAACAVDAKHVSMPEEAIRDIDTALSVSFFIKNVEIFQVVYSCFDLA